MKKILVKSLKTTGKQVIEIVVDYDIGGANMFSGGSIARGYYISVTPVETGDGFRVTGAFTGICDLMEEASRFSQKVLERLAKDALQHPHLPQMLARVLRKNNLTLLHAKGDAVYWTDPDPSGNSGYGVVADVQHSGDDAVIRMDRKDGGQVECLPGELVPAWAALTSTTKPAKVVA